MFESHSPFLARQRTLLRPQALTDMLQHDGHVIYFSVLLCMTVFSFESFDT